MAEHLIRGDARRLPLADGSVHCTVTSIPYYGLRNYSLPPSVWGGDPGCGHEWGDDTRAPWANGVPGPSANVPKNGRSRGVPKQAGPFCLKCGAWRGCFGLEPSLGMYTEHCVEVFREVWRVLRDDGVLWLNVGDSYNSKPPGNKNPMSKSGLNGAQTSASYRARLEETQQRQQEGRRLAPGFKAKDRLGVPHRVVFALQEAGWYWRDEVVWEKRNAMTESVRDRTTKAHEFVFLLTKKPRYFYDAEAVREPDAGHDHARKVLHGQPSLEPTNGLLPPHTGLRTPAGRDGLGRNLRSVWDITCRSFKGAHFAVFPVALPERCIRAGTSERGCCGSCGAPWVRVLDRHRAPTRPGTATKVTKSESVNGLVIPGRLDPNVVGNRDPQRHCTVTRTVGWEPSCRCRAGSPVPCTVLDSFCGAASTGVAALRLGRHFIGVDLSGPYLDISRERLRDERDRLERPHEARRPRAAKVAEDLPLMAWKNGS